MCVMNDVLWIASELRHFGSGAANPGTSRRIVANIWTYATLQRDGKGVSRACTHIVEQRGGGHVTASLPGLPRILFVG